LGDECFILVSRKLRSRQGLRHREYRDAMTTASNPAQVERQALCDLFLEVGPDAPTLCGEWTTRDLAAHLAMRERRLDGAAGIMISAFSDHAAKVQASIAATEWTELVETVRSGPPVWNPMRITAVDKLVNTGEFFVHHEDVRRAGGEWSARELDPSVTVALTKMITRMARLLTRPSKVGVVLEPTVDGTPSTPPVIGNKAVPSVSVRGAIGELVMFVYGRQAQADVELLGNDDDIETVRNAAFGV
jgi:uncharacterized protein (TIGR03085 family)